MWVIRLPVPYLLALFMVSGTIIVGEPSVRGDSGAVYSSVRLSAG